MNAVAKNNPGLKAFLNKPLTEELLEIEAPDLRGKKRIVELLCNKWRQDFVMGDFIGYGYELLCRTPGFGRKTHDSINDIFQSRGLGIGMLFSQDAHDLVKELPSDERVNFYLEAIARKLKIDDDHKYENAKSDFVGMVLDFENVAAILPGVKHNPLRARLSQIAYKILDTEYMPMIAGDLLLISPDQFPHGHLIGAKTISTLEQTLLAQNLKMGMLINDPSAKDVLNKPPAERAEVYRGCLMERNVPSLPPKPVKLECA